MSQSNQSPLFLRDMIADVADKTNTALMASAIWVASVNQPVYFMDGHPLEIVARLQQKLKDDVEKLKRFPLIMLLHDIPVLRNSNVFHGDATLNIVIANTTQPAYNTPERYTHNFRPVLYPIYNELLRQLGKSTYFVNALAKVDHTQIDRVYWGKTGLYGNSGNTFNDYLDAIEMQGTKITVKQQHCKPLKN